MDADHEIDLDAFANAYIEDKNVHIQAESIEESSENDDVYCESVHEDNPTEWLSEETVGSPPNRAQYEHFSPANLLDLPVEILLRIFEYLECATIINSIGSVCRSLRSIVQDQKIFRARLRRRLRCKRYPAVPADEHFDWRLACKTFEDELAQWSDMSSTVTHTRLSISHASVDAVHITESGILVVGSRDHVLAAYKLGRLPLSAVLTSSSDYSSAKIFQNRTHRGWVWTLCSHKDSFCSGGWDSKVFIWQLPTGQQKAEYSCGSAVLCTGMLEDGIVAGTFAKRLVQIDPRMDTVASSHVIHKQPVLCIASTDEWIITGSEDRTLCVSDRRTQSVQCTVKLRDYALRMSLLNNQLYVGTVKGTILLYKFDRGSLSFVEQSNNQDSHSMQVTSIHATPGLVVTSCKDGVCKVWEPCSKAAVITQFKVDAQICNMYYKSRVLALGLSDGTAYIYRPKGICSLT